MVSFHLNHIWNLDFFQVNVMSVFNIPCNTRLEGWLVASLICDWAI